MSSTPPAAPAPLDPLVIAAGYARVPVVLLNGETSSVAVRLLKISELARFLSLIDADELLAEFLTDLPAGTAAGWQITSIFDVCEKGMELNFTTARRWAERRLAVGQAAAPFAAFADKQSATNTSSSAPTSP